MEAAFQGTASRFYLLYGALTLALQRPSHILTVHRSSDPSKQFIAKKVRGEESNELEIIRILDTTQPKSEHIIPLLDLFYTHYQQGRDNDEMSVGNEGMNIQRTCNIPIWLNCRTEENFRRSRRG